MISIKNIGVVIPAYDVETGIGDVLLKVMRHIPAKRICVVDDGSRDATARIADRAGVRWIRHPANRGKGEALKSGFRAAMKDNIDAVITLDGDAQHDPASIPDFINVMAETGADIVLGTRPFRIHTMPWDRIFSNRMSSVMVSALAGKWIPDSQCGYRMIRTEALKDIPLWTGHYETETELLVKMIRKGYRVGFCPVSAIQSNGSSHIHRFRDTVRFCSLLIRLLAWRK